MDGLGMNEKLPGGWKKVEGFFFFNIFCDLPKKKVYIS